MNTNVTNNKFVNEWIADMAGGLGVKSFRMWINYADMYPVDENDEVVRNQSKIAIVRDAVDRLKAAGVENFLSMTTSFVYPKDYPTTTGYVVPDPYEEYDIMPWNYFSFKDNDTHQKPWIFGVAESFDDTNSGNTAESDWQMTSNVCGLKESPLENITLRNVHLKLDGGVKDYKKDVPEEAQDYPEVFVYGRILPAKGIYFRHIDGLTLDNVTVETYRPDAREDFVFKNVTQK